MMDEFDRREDRREERKERIKRKRIAKEERKRRWAEARDDHAAHRHRSDGHEDSDPDDTAPALQVTKETVGEATRPKLYSDCLQKYWWDENNRIRSAVYNVHRPKNFPARFTGEIDEFVFVQVPSTYVGMQRYEPGKIVKTVTEDIYEVVIRDGIKVFASKDQLRQRIVYNNPVEAHDDFPFEVLAEAENEEEESKDVNEMAVDAPVERPTFWLVTVYRTNVVINNGLTDDWFDLCQEEEWTRLEEYATTLRYKRASTQGIRILDCHLSEDEVRRLVKSLLYFNISTIEFPWAPEFLQQAHNEPFWILVKANEMTLRSVANVPLLTTLPEQLMKEATKMFQRNCYGDLTLFSVNNEYADALEYTITNEGIRSDVRADQIPEDLRSRIQNLTVKSERNICANNIEHIIRGLSDVEPQLPNARAVEVELTHMLDEDDYCFDTDKFSDVEALGKQLREEMTKVVNLVDAEFIWMPTLKPWNATIVFHFRASSAYFKADENQRHFVEMMERNIKEVRLYLEAEYAGPDIMKASFDVSSNKRLTTVFEMEHADWNEPTYQIGDREEYKDCVRFQKDRSA